MGRKRLMWLLAGGVLLAAAAVSGVLWWQNYPAARELMDPEQMDYFVSWLQGFGFWGGAVLFGLQFLQVLSGFLPALPIQLAAGMTYGSLIATAFCLGAIAAGSSVVFRAVKKFGRPLVERAVSKKKLQKLRFLENARRLHLIVFILYFIPAMPKDVFTYLAALTPLTLREYLGITLIARAPSILCTTFASRALLEGNYLGAVAVFCITGGLGILGMLFHKRILSFLERRFSHKRHT